MKNICVFCGSSPGKGVKHLVAAQELGNVLVKENLRLIYGGGNIGIMGEIANTVLQYNGEVTGVIPEDLVAREAALKDVTELIIVDSMHERKAKMQELSDGFIAMSGGIGTLEEFFEIWTWAQLGIHSKPVGILNIDGYYDLLIEFIYNSVKNEFVNENNLKMIVIDSDPENLIRKMKDFKPPEVRRWMGKESV
jgi:uncharacterized protein (TIGR00730 family)